MEGGTTGWTLISGGLAKGVRSAGRAVSGRPAGRPGKSNGQAHAENANKTFVRKLLGDHRYEDSRARDLLNGLYAVQRSTSNFFEARQRLIGKRHNGRRTTRMYDEARMPDVRLLNFGCVDQDEQEALCALLPISTSRTCCPRRRICWTVSGRSSAALSRVVSEAPRLSGSASRRPARPLLFDASA